MVRNNLYKQFLMSSDEVYYDLSVCYELSSLVDSMQIVTNAVMVFSGSFETYTLIFWPGWVFFG